MKNDGHVAQSVERWHPDGTRPIWKSPGFESRRALDAYEPPDGYGCGWYLVASRSQSMSVKGPALRGCACIKHLTLNSDKEQEFQ